MLICLGEEGQGTLILQATSCISKQFQNI